MIQAKYVLMIPRDTLKDFLKIYLFLKTLLLDRFY